MVWILNDLFGVDLQVSEVLVRHLTTVVDVVGELVVELIDLHARHVAS